MERKKNNSPIRNEKQEIWQNGKPEQDASINSTRVTVTNYNFHPVRMILSIPTCQTDPRHLVCELVNIKIDVEANSLDTYLSFHEFILLNK